MKTIMESMTYNENAVDILNKCFRTLQQEKMLKSNLLDGYDFEDNTWERRSTLLREEHVSKPANRQVTPKPIEPKGYVDDNSKHPM